MKGNLFFFALGALALTACTSEDVVEHSEKSLNVIGFENVADKFTKADLTFNTLEQFNVFGFYTTDDAPSQAVEVFKNVSVTRNDAYDWNYKDDLGRFEYWIPGANYYFYAYSCGSTTKLDKDDANHNQGSFSINMDDDLAVNARVLTLNNYICDATHQHDLVYASNTGENGAGIKGLETNNQKVALQFHHLLSKVTTEFTNNFRDGYSAKVSNVRIVNLMTVGNYDPREGAGWTGQSLGANPVVNLSTAPLSMDKYEDKIPSPSVYVLPNAYSKSEDDENPSYIYLKFDLTLTNSKGVAVSTKTMTGKFSPSWAAGYIIMTLLINNVDLEHVLAKTTYHKY